jgi:hypothetical protein
VDALGLLLNVVVHPRRHGPRWRLPLAAPAATAIPFIECIFADDGYAGTQDGDDGVAHWWLELSSFQAIGRCCGSSNERPRGSVVTIDWLATSTLRKTAAAFIRLAINRIMLSRLAATAG